MSMTDPIADYLTRLRNAAKAKHRKVDIPASKVKREITRILRDYKYINNFINIDDGKQGIIRIYLKYDEDEKSVITKLIRVSKPGLRKYVGATDVPSILNNLGLAILTTPNGIVTDREAKKMRVGGEVMFYIW